MLPSLLRCIIWKAHLIIVRTLAHRMSCTAVCRFVWEAEEFEPQALLVFCKAARLDSTRQLADSGIDDGAAVHAHASCERVANGLGANFWL